MGIDTSTTAAAVSCPICTGESRTYCAKHSHGHDWEIRECPACGHGFVSNRPDLGLLREIYASEKHQEMPEQTEEALRGAIDARRIAARICRGRSRATAETRP